MDEDSSYHIKDDFLVFNFGFNEPITEKYVEIMKKVKRIHFGQSFNQLVDNLPNNIIEIHFGYSFDKYIDNLPDGLEELYLGYLFNRPMNNLPKSLRKLVLSYYFNKPLDNLPCNLKELIVNDVSNYPLDMLPHGLEVLRFKGGSIYRHSLDYLPCTIRILDIPINYDMDLNNLPDSVEEMYIGVKEDFTKSFMRNRRFEVIKEISSRSSPLFKTRRINKLPAKLKKLYVFSEYDYIDELKNKLGSRVIVVK